MNCKKCGCPLGEETKFCPNCGTKNEVSKRCCPECGSEYPPEKPKRPIALILVSLIAVAIAIVLTGICYMSPVRSNAESNVAGKTFATPLEALTHYIEGVSACDLKMMSEAYAIDKSSQGYNFAFQANRLKTIIPTSTLLPSEYKQFVFLNKVEQLRTCVFTYKSILYALNDINWLETISGVDDAYIRNYMKKINPESLKGIKISKFKDYTSLDPSIKGSIKVYSADDKKMYGVELECGGKSVYSEMVTVLRYGDSWYLNGEIFFNKGHLPQ